MSAVIENWAYCHNKTRTGECSAHDQHVQDNVGQRVWRYLHDSTEVPDVHTVKEGDLPSRKLELFVENAETPEPELMTDDNGYSWAKAFMHTWNEAVVSDDESDVHSVTSNDMAQWFALAIEAGRDAGRNEANTKQALREPSIRSSTLRNAADALAQKHPKVASKLRKSAGQIDAAAAKKRLDAMDEQRR